MEIVGEDGWSICIGTNSKLEFGRGLGFHVGDQTLSRRHILFELPKDDSETRVSFQVLGKNPVCVFNNGETRVFRKYDTGEMRVGDSFCVSSCKPILFKLKKKSEGKEENRVFQEVEPGESMSAEQEMVESIQSGVSEVEEDLLGFPSVDVSDIDPVKEFGFLVVGHEFDNYPKTKIRVVKEWDWFLEEQRVDSDLDEATERKRSKGKKGARRKDEGYDEEWTGESEDEEVISKVRNAKKPRYTTRSKDSNKPVGSVGGSKKSEQNKTVSVNEDEEEEDADDDEDTLGGFIVDEEEEDEDDDEEEEEEFEEDNDDEDD